MNPCPACGFTKEAHAELFRTGRRVYPWEHYCPTTYMIYPFGEWAIECKNCGLIVMEIGASADGLEETWNAMSSHKEATE